MGKKDDKRHYRDIVFIKCMKSLTIFEFNNLVVLVGKNLNL